MCSQVLRGSATYWNTLPESDQCHDTVCVRVCVVIHRGVTARMLVQVYAPGGHKCVCECMTPTDCILGATCMIPVTSSRVYGVFKFSVVSAVIVRTSCFVPAQLLLLTPFISTGHLCVCVCVCVRVRVHVHTCVHCKDQPILNHNNYC